MADISTIFWNGVKAIEDGRPWYEGAEIDPNVFSDIYKDEFGVRPHQLYKTLFENELPNRTVAHILIDCDPDIVHEVTWPYVNGRPYVGMLQANYCVQLENVPENVLACIWRLARELKQQKQL